jgi:hypothetical protein
VLRRRRQRAFLEAGRIGLAAVEAASPPGARVIAAASSQAKRAAETQYAWTLANGNERAGDSTGDFVWQPSRISAGYPATGRSAVLRQRRTVGSSATR